MVASTYWAIICWAIIDCSCSQHDEPSWSVVSVTNTNLVWTKGYLYSTSATTIKKGEKCQPGEAPLAVSTDWQPARHHAHAIDGHVAMPRWHVIPLAVHHTSVDPQPAPT